MNMKSRMDRKSLDFESMTNEFISSDQLMAVRRKWLADTLTGDQGLKTHIAYGEACRAPLDERSYVFYVDMSVSAEAAARVLSGLENVETPAGAELRFVIDSPEVREAYPALMDENAVPHELLATAGTVIAVGGLPNYFIRREGQRTVYLFDQPAKGVDWRMENAKGRISSLLNASVILVRDEDSLAVLDACYNPGALFEGEVWLAPDAARYGEDAVRYIFSGDTGLFRRCEYDRDKKRVVIYCNWKNGNTWKTELYKLLLLLDYDRYDVTMLVDRRVSDLTEERELCAMPPQVRIIFRTNTFSAGQKEFADTQSFLEILSVADDVESVLEQPVLREVFRGEWQRLIGVCHADRFIYFSRLSNLWFGMTMHLDAAFKVKYEIYNLPGRINKAKQADNLSEVRAYTNQLSMDRLLFDRLQYNSEAMKKSVDAAGIGVQTGCCSIPKDYRLLQGCREEMGRIQYEGAEYGTTPVCDDGVTIKLELYPVFPGEKKVYIVDALVSDLDTALRYFASLDEPDSELLVYGKASDSAGQLAERYGVRDRVRMAPAFGILSRTYMNNYLDQFSVCLTTDRNSYCALEKLMSLKGKTILLLDGTYETVEELPDVEDADYQFEKMVQVVLAEYLGDSEEEHRGLSAGMKGRPWRVKPTRYPARN